MRKVLAGSIFLIVGAGAASSATAQIVALRGSDTLEDVARDVISHCTDTSAGALPFPGPGFPAGTGFSYAGGGSGAGQAAMTSVPPTQNIAPMSRELNGTACTGAAAQLLVGIDGIALVGANQAHKDSLETPVGAGGNDLSDDCDDAIMGDKQIAIADCSKLGDACDGTPVGTTPAPLTPGTYTFKDWKDVLAVIYAGQNHGTLAQLGAALPVSAAPHNIIEPFGRKKRNPARIDCGSELRSKLLNSWGTIFTDTAAAGGACRDGTCCKMLKHAFRRDDLSGTTDTFVGLIGLVAIPGYTRSVGGPGAPGNRFPVIDQGVPALTASNATSNPFCNAGEEAMNKGDSDYLDLDPIRRVADADAPAGTFNFQGREQVSEGYAIPSFPPGGSVVPVVSCNDTRTQPAIVVLRDFGASNRQNFGPDPSNPNFVADQALELAKRKGLGVVLPISVPTTMNDEATAYWGAGTPVPCTPGKRGLDTMDTGNVGMNPDKTTGTTLWPVSTDAPASPAVPNYNCLTQNSRPPFAPVADIRVYNLTVSTNGSAIAGGKFVKDNYVNPSIPTTSLALAFQARVVSAFFRLHATQNTNFGAPPTDGGVPGTNICKKFDSTDQIGCLVKASPCSIGYAGRTAVDKVAPLNSMAFRLGTTAAANDAFPPSTVRIEHLVDGQLSARYQLSRTLWVNAATAAAETVNEQTLLTCFGKSPTTTAYGTSFVNNAVDKFNFVSLTHLESTMGTRLITEQSCPAVFCGGNTQPCCGTGAVGTGTCNAGLTCQLVGADVECAP